eukprot:scaffold16218_cov44-Prasinocladus_malaysianus.AAC.1
MQQDEEHLNAQMSLAKTTELLMVVPWPLRNRIRGLLSIHKGYEMEGEDGSFVCAFHNAINAVSFAVDVQLSLMKLPWSHELLSLPLTQPAYNATGKLLFRGLRVKMGICTGEAARVQ